jgi:hypothetical protein
LHLGFSSGQGAIILFRQGVFYMTNTEFQQMILKIIEYAQTTPPSEFHFICNWVEYKYFKGKRRSYKLFAKGLHKGADRLFKTYCEGIRDGSANFNKLLAYQQMLQVISFYEREIVTISEMLNEYEAYLFDGNFLNSFIGVPRAEEDLKDYRSED